jgi:hypothetical protein
MINLTEKQEKEIEEAEVRAYVKEKKKIRQARGRERARNESKGLIHNIIRASKNILNFFGFDL